MKADIIPLIVGLLVFISSLISLRIAISVAIIELLLGALAGNLGLHTEPWMMYIASLGGIFLTYLAGTEIDTKLMKEKFKASFLIGFFSFLAPFTFVALYTYFLAHWTLSASLIAGTALSTTSLAVVYSVLVETGLSKTEIGKFLMASTFITEMGTALALSIFFIKPNPYFIIFLIVSIFVIAFAAKFSHWIFDSSLLKNKVIEPEIKYIFFLLLLFIYFANLGAGQAILPAFVLGLVMSGHFKNPETKVLQNRLKTVAYAMITPIFFIVGGMKISIPLIISALGLFVILFGLKMIAKFLGVFFFAKKYIPEGPTYITLLMSTGLTFGTISSLFGLNAGIINQMQYSVLVGVVVSSGIIPTIIAQKWFMPAHEEDWLNDDNGAE